MTKTKCLMVLVLAASAAACTPDPQGYELTSSDAARDFIRSYYFMPAELGRLTVDVVEPNCQDQAGRLTGLVNPTTGECVWGLTEGNHTWISLRSTKWSETSLAHELMHLVVGDPQHLDVATWGGEHDRGWNGGRVGRANTALALNPELDEMHAPRERVQP